MPPELPQAPAMSLAARLLNIFATPGEVFDDLKTARSRVSNWLVPMVLYAVVAAISSVLVLSQPAIIEQLRAQQSKAIETKVSSGKMTQAQADQAMGAIEKFSSPAIMKVFGVFGSIVASAVSVFWWALLLWLIGRFGLKIELDFMKAAELAGLASMITTLEALLKTLLIFGFNNIMASPSLGLFLKNPDPQNKLFIVLNLLNIMTFWALVVRSIGLARLARLPFGKAAVWVFAVWAVLVTLQTGLVIALQKITG
jgi:hypothetical protein